MIKSKENIWRLTQPNPDNYNLEAKQRLIRILAWTYARKDEAEQVGDDSLGETNMKTVWELRKELYRLIVSTELSW